MVILCNCTNAHICHPIRSTILHTTECECHACNHTRIIDLYNSSDRCSECQDCTSAVYDGIERCEGVHIENGLRLCNDDTPHSGRCICGCNSKSTHYYYDLSLCKVCDIKYTQAYEKDVAILNYLVLGDQMDTNRYRILSS
jgi:hypothetical protein